MKKNTLRTLFCLLPFAPARHCLVLLLLAGGFCLLPFTSNAQVFIIGGKGLLNYTTFMNDAAFNGNKLDKTFTLGGQGGIYVRYYFNEKTYYSTTNISLAVELLIGSYGQKYKGFASDTSIHSKISISSLDVPLMLHVRGQAGLYAEAGVSFGMISGVKQDFSLEPADTNYQNMSGASVDSSFTKNNLSGIFGFGIDSELGENLNLTIGFRLTYGLTDLTEPQKSYTADYKETHSATFGFVVGLAYILNFYHDYH